MKRIPVAKSGGEDDTKSESSQSQVTLSHEERQAVYEKTRARIFSDYVESQKIDLQEKPGEDGTESESEWKKNHEYG